MSAPRSWLYVPGHRPDRVAKALASIADAVVIDLEDAVPVGRKGDAREQSLAALADRDPAGPAGPQVWVRVNPPVDALGREDVEAMAGAGADGLRLPRSQDPASVRWAAETTGLPLQLLLETARGLSRAAELAAAHELVVGLGLGEADLAADLLVGSPSGLDWARGAVVMASRAAGLASPVQSVWTDVADLDGLRASCADGLAAGFFGRSVVHPAQLPIVHEVYTPSPDAVTSARAVVAAAAQAEADGEVAFLDADGRFVDPAVVARARVVLDRVPTHVTTTEPRGH